MYSILGQLEVRLDEARVEVGGGKQRALLALLLTRVDEVLPVDAILDRLWGDHPPATAKTALQGYVSGLRKAIPSGSDRLQTVSGGYVLRLVGDELDARRFEELAESARGEIDRDPERAASLLREALGLWRGPALADFAYDAFAQAEMARLEEARLAATEDLHDAELACGRHADIVGRLEAEVAAHPLRERLRGQLILALYRSGRQAEALEAYQATRDVLVEELGIDPSPALQRLEKAILVQDPSLEAPAPTGEAARIDLPARVTSFVGRETELGELTALMREGARMVTLTGPGGTGKTRLAVEAAYALADDFSDGVQWVPLETLRDPGLVLETVSQALGLQGDLAEQIGSKRLLLVLDNLEQVIACAPNLARLLTSCPGLTLLATSREPLHVGGEQEYPVPTLSADDGTALFVARARLVQPSFQPTEAVDAICRRLDDLPLALELAAARTKLLSPEQLLERLSSRLDLLKGGRDADPRRQTLRATIEWSFDLLTDDEQRLFARLSAFIGGCTLESADQVADADLDTVQSLLDKSFLKRRDDLGEPRFWMLETIREYGLERLVADEPGAATVRERHAGYFLDLAEKAREPLRGPDQTRWLDRLEAERPNVRAALVHYIASGDVERAIRLAGAYGNFWYRRSLYGEGRQWLEGTLALGGEPSPARARAWLGLGNCCAEQGDLDAAQTAYEAALRDAREVGDDTSRASSLNNLGGNDWARGDWPAAAERFTEALELVDASSGDAAMYLSNLGSVALMQGDVGLARSRFEESLALRRALGDDGGIAASLFNLGLALFELGESDGARGCFLDCLDLVERLGDPLGFSELADASALVAGAGGDAGRAARLTGAANELRNELGASLSAAMRARRARWVDPVRDADPEAFERGVDEGAALAHDIPALLAELRQTG